MKTYGEQVAERLCEFGQSKFGKKRGWRTRFAVALEMELQPLNPYLNGERLPGNVLLARLRNYLNAPTDWIMYGEAKDEQKNELFIPTVTIPVYAHVNAGTKKWVVSDEIVDYVGVPKSSDTSLKGLIVKGNSMADEIKDGDIVIISDRAEIRNNDLCVVEFDDGERNLRRVTIDKHNVILTSNQGEEYPLLIVAKSKITKLYRVMQHTRKY